MKASKSNRSERKKSETKRTTQQRQEAGLETFYVPGRGKVMAAGIDDVANQLSDKSREEGDGNS
ncbi:hypothetical protein [Dietzia maris]|uniref:hypothetical protein n=1 Tax=Dietzia maris TaxID=37915 RepID=UPI0037C96040